MISKLRQLSRVKNFKLSTKLIATYMMLTVIPMALLGYIAYTQYTKSIEEQVGEYIPRLLMQSNQNIEHRFNEIEHLPDLIYSSESVMSVLRNNEVDKKWSELHREQYIVKNFLSSTFLNNNNSDILGAYFLSNNRAFTSTRVINQRFMLDRSSFQLGEDLKIGGGMKILLPNQTNLTFTANEPYLLLIKEIIDFDNRKKLGTLFLAVKMTFIEDILEDLDKEKNAVMWMMNKDGRILYHTDYSKIGTIFNEINEYPIFNGSFRTSINGERTLISVDETVSMNWVLAHSIPIKHLTERTDVVRNVIIFIFIILVIVTTSISIFLALTVTRPINTLGKLMKEVEKGNFEVKIPVHSQDEVGMLARSFHSMITKIRNLIRKNYNTELRQKNAELYALQSQINPHFMYNTLETIGMAVEEGESETVVDMVTLLGNMLRFSLGNKDRFVSISKEIQHVNNYLILQNFRFEDRLSFQILETVDCDSYFTPKFVLQPIVENAIKYGLEKRKGITIQIEVLLEKNSSGAEDILLVVRDNGPGIDNNTLENIDELLKADALVNRDSGFGITNVHARIANMFGNGYGVEIQSKVDRGTDVIIRIPKLDVRQLSKFESNEEEMFDDND